MQTYTNAYGTSVRSPAREIKGRVILFNPSNAGTYTGDDAIQSFKIERSCEDGKFFGLNVMQKLTLELLDKTRTIVVEPGNYFKVDIGLVVNSSTIWKDFPRFYVDEVTRNENTNTLTITAYDLLYKAKKHTVSELSLSKPYTITQFVTACATLLGTTVSVIGVPQADVVFSTSYTDGANFDGTESLYDALRMAAETTQTVVYVNYNNALCFKRMGSASNWSITKDDYFTLTSGATKLLQTIASVTALGDNVSASGSNDGETQYCRDNAFWDLRSDLATLLNNAVEYYADTTNTEYSLKFRGMPCLEIGDRITVTTKDNGTVGSFYLKGTLNYTGGLSDVLSWAYKPSEATATNPTNIVEVITKTMAQVDKQAGTITMLASKAEGNEAAIAQLQIDKGGIEATVSAISQTVTDNKDATDGAIATLTETVNAKVDATSVTLAIQEELAKGTSKVTTETGFTFDKDGLTVSKTGSEMTTTIDEDGMTVKQNNTDVLVADSHGVNAKDLTAINWLIVGHTRFMDYSNGTRTGAFWLG